jgi:hypothetical protein
MQNLGRILKNVWNDIKYNLIESGMPEMPSWMPGSDKVNSWKEKTLAEMPAPGQKPQLHNLNAFSTAHNDEILALADQQSAKLQIAKSNYEKSKLDFQSIFEDLTLSHGATAAVGPRVATKAGEVTADPMVESMKAGMTEQYTDMVKLHASYAAKIQKLTASSTDYQIAQVDRAAQAAIDKLGLSKQATERFNLWKANALTDSTADEVKHFEALATVYADQATLRKASIDAITAKATEAERQRVEKIAEFRQSLTVKTQQLTMSASDFALAQLDRETWAQRKQAGMDMAIVKQIHDYREAMLKDISEKKKVADQQEADATTKPLKEAAEFRASLLRKIQQLTTKSTDFAIAELERETKALRDKAGTDTELIQMVNDYHTAALTDITKQHEKSTSKMTEFAKSAAQSMQSSLADFFFDPFEDGLQGMLASFLTVIQRMVAEMTAAMVIKEALGSYGTTGTLSGWVGTAVSAVTSAWTGTAQPGQTDFVGPLQTNATGGDVTAGQSYLIGEQGPEVWRAPANGTIIPNNAIGGGSTNVTLNVINNSGQQVQTRQETEQNGQDTIVTLWLDAYQNNRRGLRTAVQGGY